MHRVGQEEEWYKLLDKYINESNATEKPKLLDGLMSIQYSPILTK